MILPQSTTYFDFRLFADDSNIFHSFPPPPPSQIKVRLFEITDHLLYVTKWCDANKITINIKKTNLYGYTATGESGQYRWLG